MQKYITPKGFVKLPLSEAIPYVIADLKKFVKRGYQINMNYWFVIPEENCYNRNACSACLGGVAILGFYDEEMLKENTTKSASYGRTLKNITDGFPVEGEKIALTFNYLRQGVIFEALTQWYGKIRETREEIYDIFYYVDSSRGLMDRKSLKKLESNLKSISNELSKMGY